MPTVTSKDGTAIAFERSGAGSPLILVDGALCHRAFGPMRPLSALLSPHFTVFIYDRRGRGESADTLPYAVEREVEDIEALINGAGGSAFLYGTSSGGALALETAIRLGSKIKKLAEFEAPYNDDPNVQPAYKQYTKQLNEALATNNRGDAAAAFMKYVGTPAEQIEGMRHTPVWSMFEAVAPTLAYDAAVLGEGAAVPTQRAASIGVPTLVMNGGAGFPFMRATAESLASAIPDAKHHVVEGQGHDAAAEAIAPVLIKFFSA